MWIDYFKSIKYNWKMHKEYTILNFEQYFKIKYK